MATKMYFVANLYDEDAPIVSRRLRSLGYETQMAEGSTAVRDTFTRVWASPRPSAKHKKQALEGIFDVGKKYGVGRMHGVR